MKHGKYPGILNQNFHSFFCKTRGGKYLLTLFFHSVKKIVVMIRIVMRNNEFLNFSSDCNFNSLFPGTMTPSFMLLVFFRGVLTIMNKQICIHGKFYNIFINPVNMLNIGTHNKRGCSIVYPQTVRTSPEEMVLRGYSYIRFV